MNYSEALESKWVARRYWKRSYDDGLIFKSGVRPEHRQLIVEQTQRAIRSLAAADPYFWNANISAAVVSSSASLPMDTTLKQGREKPEWWFFEKPIDFEGFSDIQAVLLTPLDFLHNGRRWMEVIPFNNRLISTRSMLFNVDHDCTIGSVLASGKGKPVALLAPGTATISEANTSSFLQFYVASQLWLEQEIIQIDTVQAERHYRRRLASTGIDPQSINLVRLRRVVRQQVAASNDAAVVEWSCQWVVRGHWRQQYYPSSGERRPLWILPYVKGPEDKPLKLPAPTIFVVTR